MPDATTGLADVVVFLGGGAGAASRVALGLCNQATSSAFATTPRTSSVAAGARIAVRHASGDVRILIAASSGVAHHTLATRLSRSATSLTLVGVAIADRARSGAEVIRIAIASRVAFTASRASGTAGLVVGPTGTTSTGAAVAEAATASGAARHAGTSHAAAPGTIAAGIGTTGFAIGSARGCGSCRAEVTAGQVATRGDTRAALATSTREAAIARAADFAWKSTGLALAAGRTFTKSAGVARGDAHIVSYIAAAAVADVVGAAGFARAATGLADTTRASGAITAGVARAANLTRPAADFASVGGSAREPTTAGPSGAASFASTTANGASGTSATNHRTRCAEVTGRTACFTGSATITAASRTTSATDLRAGRTFAGADIIDAAPATITGAGVATWFAGATTVGTNSVSVAVANVASRAKPAKAASLAGATAVAAKIVEAVAGSACVISAADFAEATASRGVTSRLTTATTCAYHGDKGAYANEFQGVVIQKRAPI